MPNHKTRLVVVRVVSWTYQKYRPVRLTCCRRRCGRRIIVEGKSEKIVHIILSSISFRIFLSLCSSSSSPVAAPPHLHHHPHSRLHRCSRQYLHDEVRTNASGGLWYTEDRVERLRTRFSKSWGSIWFESSEITAFCKYHSLGSFRICREQSPVNITSILQIRIVRPLWPSPKYVSPYPSSPWVSWETVYHSCWVEVAPMCPRPRTSR